VRLPRRPATPPSVAQLRAQSERPRVRDLTCARVGVPSMQTICLAPVIVPVVHARVRLSRAGARATADPAASVCLHQRTPLASAVGTIEMGKSVRRPSLPGTQTPWKLQRTATPYMESKLMCHRNCVTEARGRPWQKRHVNLCALSPFRMMQHAADEGLARGVVQFCPAVMN